MYKNQLQELAQRSCFNLPSYACIREGPDHAPRFKATVTFNGENFESPAFYTTLRQAEHAAAEVALNTLSKRSPSKTLAARVLDDTGVYKNLLQETAHRAGLNLPVYTTVRSGPSHTPVFSCTVELACMRFTGEPAKTKKQAQKNAAMAAWSALKQFPNLHASSSASSSSSCLSFEPGSNDEQEKVVIARVLASFHISEEKKPSLSDAQLLKVQHKTHSSPKDVRTSTGAGASYFSFPCQNWAYSSFSPELIAYQMWIQGQAIQQQNRLLALSSQLTCDPRLLQYSHSSIHLNQGHFFPVIEQELVGGFSFLTAPSASSLCYPFYSPSPSEILSQVTLQGIHERNQACKQEWLGNGITGVHGEIKGINVNHPSEPMILSHFDDLNSPVVGSSELKFEECVEEESYGEGDGGKYSASEMTGCDSGLKQDDHSSCRNVSPVSFSTEVTREIQETERFPREQSEKFHQHSACCYHEKASKPQLLRNPVSNLSSNLPTRISLGPAQTFRHPPVATEVPTMARVCPAGLRIESRGPPVRSHLSAPVMIRTAVPVYSARSGLETQSLGVPTANSIPPTVDTKSVGPASSLSSVAIQDANYIGAEQPEAMLTATDDFRKLQI